MKMPCLLTKIKLVEQLNASFFFFWWFRATFLNFICGQEHSQYIPSNSILVSSANSVVPVSQRHDWWCSLFFFQLLNLCGCHGVIYNTVGNSAQAGDALRIFSHSTRTEISCFSSGLFQSAYPVRRNKLPKHSFWLSSFIKPSFDIYWQSYTEHKILNFQQ